MTQGRVDPRGTKTQPSSQSPGSGRIRIVIWLSVQPKLAAAPSFESIISVAVIYELARDEISDYACLARQFFRFAPACRQKCQPEKNACRFSMCQAERKNK